ncbi:MAG: iron-sulfur cluster assembly protein [Euryarchaeota archaeon]|nr:iron-sulfur cluster assembly protein [Euryarchaeota archaeon]
MLAALSRVISPAHRKNIVEAGMVVSVHIQGGEVRVVLRRPKECVCTQAFVLAVLAEREVRKLEWVTRAKVEVALNR